MEKHKAVTIAEADLDACMSTIGVVAGTHHFVDLWARDSLFATFGMNIAGRGLESKKTIETFLNYQREDGLIPYLVQRSRLTLGKYIFGHHRYYKNPVSSFRCHQSGGLVPDGGLMTVIAAGEYLRQSFDRKFLQKHYTKLVHTLAWYNTQFHGELISEWFLCEWADAVLKIGNTLYTNVLYWKALGDMSWLAGKLNKQSDARRFAQLQKTIGKRLNTTLWNGSYFSDWKDWKRQDYFASHQNMLAIVFGLASRVQAKSILRYAKLQSWNGLTLKTNIPQYPWWRIPFHHHILGLPDYHNGLSWLQPGIMYSLALHKCGNILDSKQVLLSIAQKIEEYQGVHEVYEKDGRPVSRRFYRSEQPFAWSAGLFLYANKIIR